MRDQSPWYRTDRNAWYVEVRGKQEPLGKHPEASPTPRKGKKGWNAPPEITAAFYRLMASGGGKLPEPASLQVASVCDLFLTHSEKHNDGQTFRWYQKYLQSFCDLFGTLPALDVKPFHVSAWLDAHPKWASSRRCAVICVKRAYNWAEGEGLLPTNPMKKVKKPSPVRRERTVTQEEWDQLVGAVRDQEFRDFLFALRQTGCRPSEVRKVTAAQVDFELGVWILQHHKTRKKTGVARIVYLTPDVIELCGRLCARWPEGPIFRGPKWKGYKPFTKNAVRCRFMRLRKKLPQLAGVISYTVRHSYITDALERGVPVATVAELAGHKDLKMIQSHYCHLSEKRKHLQDAARKAAGCGEAPPEEKRPA
jgi:integrase